MDVSDLDEERLRRGAGVGIGEGQVGRLQQRPLHLVDDRCDEGFLGREVPVDRTDADSGATSDLLKRCLRRSSANTCSADVSTRSRLRRESARTICAPALVKPLRIDRRNANSAPSV